MIPVYKCISHCMMKGFTRLLKIGAGIEIQSQKIVSRLVLTTMKNLGYIINFVCVKQLLLKHTTMCYQPVRQSTEIHFECKNIEEIIHSFEDKVKRWKGEKTSERFQLVYSETDSLANKFLLTRMTTLCGQKLNRNIIPSEIIKEYWQRPAYLLFFDSAFADIKSVFSQEKKVYY